MKNSVGYVYIKNAVTPFFKDNVEDFILDLIPDFTTIFLAEDGLPQIDGQPTMTGKTMKGLAALCYKVEDLNLEEHIADTDIVISLPSTDTLKSLDVDDFNSLLLNAAVVAKLYGKRDLIDESYTEVTYRGNKMSKVTFWEKQLPKLVQQYLDTLSFMVNATA